MKDLAKVKAMLDFYKTIAGEQIIMSPLSLGEHAWPYAPYIIKLERLLNPNDFQVATLNSSSVAAQSSSSYDYAKRNQWEKDFAAKLKEKNLAELAHLIDELPDDEGYMIEIAFSYQKLGLMANEFASLMPQFVKKIKNSSWGMLLWQALQDHQYESVRMFFRCHPNLIEILWDPFFAPNINRIFFDTEAISTLQDVYPRIVTALEPLLAPLEQDPSLEVVLMSRMLDGACESPLLRDAIPLEKFKLRNHELGIAWFYKMLFYPQNKEWVIKAVQADPSLLELRSVEGLDWEKLTSFIKLSGEHHAHIRHIESTLQALKTLNAKTRK